MALFKYILISILGLILVAFLTLGIIDKNNDNLTKAQNVVKNEFNTDFEYKAEYSFGEPKNQKEELKLLVLGNSISSGVIVSNIKDDYVNVLIRKISIKQNNRLVRARVYNLANFERHYSNYDYNILKPLVEYKPDIIIFQLGENYKRENDELYFKQLVKLINYFGNDEFGDVCRDFDEMRGYLRNSVDERLRYEKNRR